MQFDTNTMEVPFATDKIKNIRWTDKCKDVITKYTMELDSSMPYLTIQSMNVLDRTHRLTQEQLRKVEYNIITIGARVLQRMAPYKEIPLGELYNRLTVQYRAFRNKSAEFDNTQDERNLLAVSKLTSKIFWDNRCDYPSTKELAFVVSAIYALIPTEAASERAFSVYNIVRCKKRNKLGYTNGLNELLIRFNARQRSATFEFLEEEINECIALIDNDEE
jgi:hypothetical protein